jgi:acrylyl-CoA reductase (NADPH)
MAANTFSGDTFAALVLDEPGHAEVRRLSPGDLPEGDVTVRVIASSLNYKDGLAVAGKARVVRRYPMVPGVDLVGEVEESSTDRWKPGDVVILNGFGSGETQWGGYAQRARLRGEQLVRLPKGLTPLQAAQLGTAGYTAMLAVMALEAHGGARDGEIVVTGAAGGVGSASVALLASLGYQVVASTGREETHDYLRDLGAGDIIGRDVLAAPSQRPLESGRWAGAIDNVGGSTLAGLLRTMAPHGSIASCGNAGGIEVQTTVLPFILRGVSVLGIDSNYAPLEQRTEAWNRLARDFPSAKLDAITQDQSAPLDTVPKLAGHILRGEIRGRMVIVPG